jgi:hypothetical protein
MPAVTVVAGSVMLELILMKTLGRLVREC